LASFYTLLYSHRVRRKEEDKLWWAPSHKGNFDVRSLYKILACKDAFPFPWKSIWRTQVPSNVALLFFPAWLAAIAKILTMYNLKKRHVTVVIGAACANKMWSQWTFFFLLHCKVACALWNAIFNRFGMSWVMLN